MKVTELDAADTEATGTISYKIRNISSTMKLNDVPLKRYTCQRLLRYSNLIWNIIMPDIMITITVF